MMDGDGNGAFFRICCGVGQAKPQKKLKARAMPSIAAEGRRPVDLAGPALCKTLNPSTRDSQKPISASTTAAVTPVPAAAMPTGRTLPHLGVELGSTWTCNYSSDPSDSDSWGVSCACLLFLCMPFDSKNIAFEQAINRRSILPPQLLCQLHPVLHHQTLQLRCFLPCR